MNFLEGRKYEKQKDVGGSIDSVCADAGVQHCLCGRHKRKKRDEERHDKRKVDGMKNGKVNGDKPQDQTDEQPDSQPDAKPAEPSDEQPDQTKDASNAPMDAALAKQLYSDGSLTQEQYNALTEALDGQSAATLQTLLDGNYISQELYDVLIAALQK